MQDTFTITELFIVLSTIIAAFIKRISKDKCLKDFADDVVTLEEIKGKTKGTAPRILDHKFSRFDMRSSLN